MLGATATHAVDPITHQLHTFGMNDTAAKLRHPHIRLVRIHAEVHDGLRGSARNNNIIEGGAASGGHRGLALSHIETEWARILQP